MPFPDPDLALLGETKEIEIETRSASGDIHRTIIWPLVRDGVVYLRSYKGPAGRWYREALANPNVAFVADDGVRIEGRALPATDPASVEACSEALRAKYRRSYSLEAMLAPQVLPTTLRIDPIESPST